jgi:hypothetical protein
MIADIVFDVLGAVLDGILPCPSGSRGRALLQLVGGSAGLAIEVWAYASVDDWLRGPDWAFRLMMIGMLLGLAGLIASLLNLVQVKDHRTLTAFSPLLGAIAVVWPLSLTVW